MDRTIEVVLQTLSGKPLNLVVRPNRTASSLKREAASLTGVPPEFLTLIIGGAELHDLETFEAICKNGTTSINATLLLSFEILREDLKVSPLKALGKIRKLGCSWKWYGEVTIEQCVEMVSLCIRKGYGEVCIEAMKTLAHIANPSCLSSDVAIAALDNCMQESRDWEFRCAAAETLGKISRRDDGHVIQLLALGVSDKYFAVRRAALAALEQISERGNMQTLVIASTALGDRDWEVRLHALRVFQYVAEQSNEAAIVEIMSCLSDENWEVRLGALKAISTVAGRGSDPWITAVSMLQDDPCERVQTAAMTALAAFTADQDTGDCCAPKRQKML
mmetsp:Transcript_75620/g.130944  ORF Transcript_75620/g.130944 Transcript_75620/m.130944 type:complete len:334 (+) Transcript_75620:55-1056(+)